MPGKQEHTNNGMRYEVEPSFWLRRITHFPLHFQHYNSSFRVKVTRVSDGTPPKELPRLEIALPNNTTSHREPPAITALHWPDDVEWPKGSSVVWDTGPIFSASTGQVILRLRLNQTQFADLYAYKVREEETIWFWGVGIAWVLLQVLIGAFGIYFGGRFSQAQADAQIRSAEMQIQAQATMGAAQPVINVAPVFVIPTQVP